MPKKKLSPEELEKVFNDFSGSPECMHIYFNILYSNFLPNYIYLSV